MRLDEINDVRTELEHLPPNYISLIKKSYENRNFLFRGISVDKPFVISDGAVMNRVPAAGINSPNILNRLTEILPSWKGWPSRTKSYSCTSSLKSAESWSGQFNGIYAKTFVVIPLENQPIGVITSSSDFWSISNQIGEVLFGSGAFSGFGTLNRFLSEIIRKSGGNHSSLDSVQKLLKDLQRFYNKYTKENNEVKPYTLNYVNDYWNIDCAEYFKKLMDRTKTFSAFMKLFDVGMKPEPICKLLPNINDSFIEYAYQNKQDYEFWLSGKVMFVNLPSYARINKVPFDKMIGLLK